MRSIKSLPAGVIESSGTQMGDQFEMRREERD